MYLGLDVSTTCTGVAILDENKKLILQSHITTTKVPTLTERALIVEDYIKELHNDYNITYVGIEAPLLSFKKGFTNTTTLTKLLMFNGIVSYIVYKELGVKPTHKHVSSARKMSSYNIMKKFLKQKTTKNKIVEFVDKMLKDFKIEFTKNNTIKSYIYDEADAAVVALAIFQEEANTRIQNLNRG